MGNDSKLGLGAVGPWSVTHNSWEVSTVYGPDGETVAECPINSIVTEDTQFEHEAVKEANALAIGKLPDLMALLHELVEAMERYQMDVDGDAPPRHRDMMERAYALLPPHHTGESGMIELKFVNSDARQKITVLQVSTASIEPIMAWYGAYYAGDRYAVYADGEKMPKDQNSELAKALPTPTTGEA